MRVPERLKPRLAGFDFLLPAIGVPVAFTGIIVLLTEALLRLGVMSAGPSNVWRDFWTPMVWGVDFIAAAWIDWYLHRMKNTYDPLRFRGGILRRLATGVVWIFLKSLFFGICAILALFMVVPVVLGLTVMATLILEREPTFPQRIVSDAALLMGLSTAVIGLTAFSRAFWLWSALRHVVLLPTAPGASPPEGLVELRGVAKAREGNGPALAKGSVGPFFVESAGRQILVEPPEGFELSGGQAFLPEDGSGGTVLRAGEPVLVLGRLERSGGEPVLRPCPSPRGSLVFTGKKRFFSLPNLFLIAHGDEAAAKRRLARTHLLWIGVASFLTIGGLLVALVGLAARLSPEFIRALAVAGGGR